MQKLLSLNPNLTEVSAQLGFKNLARNGNMDYWQRGVTFPAVVDSTFLADGYQLLKISTAIGEVSQQLDTPGTLSTNLSTYSLRHRVTTAQATMAAGNYYIISQKLEGWSARSLRGQPFTISFWVKAGISGRYCLSIRNGALEQSYIAEYTVVATNTWERKVVTVPRFPASGTWDITNGVGLIVCWALAAGAGAFQTTTPNVWQAGNFLVTPNQVNAIGVLNNDFSLAEVQIEAGAVATDFEFRPVVIEALLAKRYYTTLSLSPGGFTPSMPNGWAPASFAFPVPMRTTPTAALLRAGTRVGLSNPVSNSLSMSVHSNEGGVFTIFPNQAGSGASHFYIINDVWSFSAEI